jgi:Transposase zinc-ribbon domain/ISXO2-like transposase domain
MKIDDFPKTVLEFEAQFATEDACVAYMRAKKWPQGFRCSKCGGTRSWPVRRLEECAACGHQESVTAGTLFHQTRKPLQLWFRAISLWVASKRGLSAKELARQLGVHYETAWHWCHRLRACVGASFGKEPLMGVVEVDETRLGGSDDRADVGRSLARHKALVIGAVEVRGHAMGRTRLKHLACATAQARSDFAARNVSALACTRGLDAPHSKPFVGPLRQRSASSTNGTHFTTGRPRIRRVFSLFQRAVLGTFHGSVSHKHLSAYLCEFEFRFNRRTSGSRWLLFHRILQAAPGFSPPTLVSLTRKVATP